MQAESHTSDVRDHATQPIQSATTAEQDDVVAVMMLAFSRDPVTRWVWPNGNTLVTHYPAFVRAFAGKAFEHGSAFRTADFAGVALWLPPHVESDAERMAALVETTVEKDRLPSLYAFMEQMGGYHPKEPHWYLPLIGCDPAHQGRGIGSALMRHALARVDGDGLPAYLESSNPANVPLYQRHGFEVTGTIQVDGGPRMFPMWRPGRRG